MSIPFSTLTFSGDDSGSFLQGQLTADIQNLTMLDHTVPQQGLAGICNNKGRLVAILWLIHHSDSHISAILPTELAEKVKNHLMRFIFRSKVEISIIESSADDLALLPNSLTIPWITEKTSEKYVPQMVSLDLLLGISFKKGCYTGQEIIARMHFLGTHKRRLARIKFDSKTPSIGDTIKTEDDIHAGDIVYYNDHFKNMALVVLYLDHKNKPLTLNQNPISIDMIWEDSEGKE